MPNRDGTGPRGKGAKTGRQLGNCASAKPLAARQLTRGLGRRNGRGLGRRWED